MSTKITSGSQGHLEEKRGYTDDTNSRLIPQISSNGIKSPPHWAIEAAKREMEAYRAQQKRIRVIERYIKETLQRPPL